MVCSCNEKTGNSKLSAGIKLENLDTTTSPGTDFYEYACGGWRKNNPLTGEYSRFGSFDKLAENNRQKIKSLIEEIAAKNNDEGSLAQKIGDLYNMGMDSVKLNADGITPLKPILDSLGSMDDKSDLSKAIPEMMLRECPVFFGVSADADSKNSALNILWINQGGLSMGDRDYYMENDANTVGIRDAFVKHVAKMFELCGFDKETAVKNSDDVMRIETKLASAHYDKVRLRDPYANYNKMNMDSLQELVPAINWKTFFEILGINESELSVGQPEAIEEVGKVMEEEPISSLIAYMQWNAINESASYLNDALYEENFNFYGKIMSGKQTPQPRWKRAQSAVNLCLGEAVGHLYVEKYFPPEAKERMLELVHNLQKAYAQRIRNLDWMSDSTKDKAIEKLDAFYIKIGYPNKWKDYSKLSIGNDSYLANIMRASEFEMRETLDRAGKPVDRDRWEMTPQTVNAYYNPPTNEICFPAGILQYPFFDMDADDAFNYGAIGVVIGHEMTHGFDDQGRQFDKDGNLSDWWTSEDAEQFKKRAKVMSDFYDGIEVAPGVHANGKFTLGETIADYGGLQISFQAYKKATKNDPAGDKEGFTADQRFFLSFANVWAGNIRDAEVLRRTKTDVHALAKWRVDGELPQTDAWYDAFGITEKDPMFLPKSKRVTIW
ncbi:MAG: M13 family metallopeptidase [Bacteroidales bacterium]|jgi:putative endopeptidase|nr:M13 family metallopeptidase [Bacteroidales bacterium]MCI2122158.1 M13 family metallopeptidase [Bacteroidales bacterium]MCI2144678.1 M13 family metallopeptidase [Bacteroidales bacterium]